MNCFEKLNGNLQECEPCFRYGKIIELEQLPEEEKFNFDSYDKEQDLILYCEKCNYFKHLNTDTI
jgi:hypothetical protein